MKRTPAIVAAGPVVDPAPALLSRFGALQIAERDDEAALRPLLGEAVGLVARGPTRVSASLLEAAPRLRVIGRTGVGVDGIDLRAATERRIPVVITPGCNDAAVAEGTIAMLLALVKRLPQLDTAVREGAWGVRDTLPPRDVAGTTLAVAGFGRIGRRVAALARALGMRVLACDPLVTDSEARAADVERRSLSDAVAEADHLTLHVPLTTDTRGLVDSALLAAARPGLHLVNVSRGPVAPLDALLDGLSSGALGGVALDVFEKEPPDLSHRIFCRDDVIVTPHSMGMTPRAAEATARAMADGMIAVLDGQRPSHVANPEVFA